VFSLPGLFLPEMAEKTCFPGKGKQVH